MDTALQKILQSLDALDLSNILSSRNVKANELGLLSLGDLEKFGIASERAEKFLSEVKKEDRRKQSLQQKLKETHCLEILNFLTKEGYKADEIFSLDHDALSTSGLSFGERKRVIEKLQNGKKSKIKGNK